MDIEEMPVMGNEKAKKRAVLKVVELSDSERVKLQQVFLDAFLKWGKFTAACNVLHGEDGRMDEHVVGVWIEDDPEFRAEYEKVKRVLERIDAHKAQEFLNAAGSGKKAAEKGGVKLTQAEVVAAHMILEAHDKAKWSSKVAVEKTETRNITTIIKHYGGDDTKVETIDAPEVKKLTDGDSDNRED